MPAFAWLIKGDDGKAKMSPPVQHTCFASVPGFGMRSMGRYDSSNTPLPSVYKFIFYASCHGTYEDAVLFAEKVNESSLTQFPFTLTAHDHGPDNPFAKERWGGQKVSPSYGMPGYDTPYWALEWPIGTQWDMVYAVTKLIFKNITYGHRMTYGDAHGEMMKFLREGANIFEAMVYQSSYGGNGYTFPCFIRDKTSAKRAYKFTQKGPTFNTSDWYPENTLGSTRTFNINGNHKPFVVSYDGTSISFGGINKTTNLETFRAKLREAAGVN